MRANETSSHSSHNFKKVNHYYAHNEQLDIQGPQNNKCKTIQTEKLTV